MNHIMLDLETFDTSTNAVVLSIGAVAFDLHNDNMGDKFYVELTDDTATQQDRGRSITGDNVKWWMKQSALARQIFAEHPQPGIERVSTHAGLSRFALFVQAHGGQSDAKVWGNGADFDNIILGSLYEDFGLRVPWSYSNNRCYRTIKNLGFGPRKAKREGVHHNALDDAITQARHLQEMYACLKNC